MTERSEKRRRNKVLTLRVTEAELDELHQTAERRNQSVSALVRQRALHPERRILRVPDERPDGLWAAMEEMDFRWTRYAVARTVSQQADAFTALQNAWSNLRSWHPQINADGMLPWERRANE